MDLRKIDQIREMQIRSWKLQHFIVIVLVAWSLILTPITFSIFLESCKNDLRELKLNLNSQLQQYHTNLRNTRWAMSRFNFLRHHFLKTETHLLNTLEGIFLPGFSFGNQNEYFLLRNLEGVTKLEAVRGALVSRHSEVFIPNERELVKRGEGIFTTPCKINSVSYLCIVSTPDLRVYEDSSERYISVGVIPRSELYTLSRAAEVQQYSFFRTDQPGFHFSFDPDLKEQLEGVKSFKGLFRQNTELFPGFWVSLSYPWKDFLIVTSGAILFLVFLVTGIGLIIHQLFERRVKNELEIESLKNQKESYDRVQLLVKGVIHDIESPLAALRVLSAGEQDADRKSMFDLLFKRIRLIVSDLEGKGNSGARVDPSYLPLIKTLNSTVLEKQKEIGGRATLSLDVGQVSSAWIFGVYSDFCRMLSNIINNAVQASERGSHVRVHLDLNRVEQKVRIFIVDRGKGIPPEMGDRIFEKGATFGKKGGTGIGLFQARNAARAMAGEILVRGNDGGPGTTVEIALPLFDAPSWFRSQLQLIRGGQVVLVDDEEIIEKIFQERLKKSGIHHPIRFFSHPNLVPQELILDPKTYFVVDNNYGVDLSAGIQFCQKLPPERTLLFTSDWNLQTIQLKADDLKIGLLGKEFLEHIQFVEV